MCTVVFVGKASRPGRLESAPVSLQTQATAAETIVGRQGDAIDARLVHNDINLAVSLASRLSPSLSPELAAEQGVGDLPKTCYTKQTDGRNGRC